MKGRLVAAVAVVVAVAATAGTYAWATGGGGAVAACAQKVNGQLRLDTGGGCRPSEDQVALAAAGGSAQPMYAHVDDGVLDAAHSSGVLSMTHTTVVAGTLSHLGVYCFDLAGTPVNVVATGALGPYVDSTVGVGFSSGVQAAGVAGTAGFDGRGCPAGTDAIVEAGLSFGSSPITPGSFYALFQS